MGDEAELLRAILARFAHDPDDAQLWPTARELADRFTMDQLCAMAPSRSDEVTRMFDRIMGRAMRRDRRDARRAMAAGDRAQRWNRRQTDRVRSSARTDQS